VGRADASLPVAPEFAVAEVVGHDPDQVGAPGRRGRLAGGRSPRGAGPG
jgi:hypothetical protein